jgi:uncharacterized protein YkwD
MRLLFFILLLALFVVPLGIDRASHLPDSPSNLSPSVSVTATRVDSEPSRVSTTSARTTARAAAPETAVVEVTTANATPEATASHAQPTVTTKPLSDSVISDMEAEILRLTNIERAAAGLSPFSSDTKLREIAALHSEDMLTNEYFEHEDPAGCSSPCRATNAGYRWRAIGENIYMMSGYSLNATKMAAQVVAGWMDSPGHRANILGTSFVESGVGVAIEGKDVYVTAVYGKER